MVCSRPRATIFSRSVDRRDWSKRSAIHARDHAGLGRERLGAAEGADLVVAAPELAEVLARDGGDGGRHLAGPFQQRLVGDDLDDEAPVARRLGVDVVAGQAHAAGPVEADELRQPDGHAAAGHDADPGVRVGEARPLRGDEEVAAHGELEPARHGRAVDGADDRGVVRRHHPGAPRRAALSLLLHRTQLGGQ